MVRESSLLALMLGALTLTSLMGASPKKSKTNELAVPPVAAPVYVRERTYADLANFGKLVRAYTPMLGDKRILVAVNYIRNLAGVTDGMPSDLSDYVVNAIAKMGPQFGTYHQYEAPVGLPGAFFNPQADGLKPPPASFRISGNLQAVVDLVKQDKKHSLAVTGGKGHGEFDGQLSHDRTKTIKFVTVSLNLEGPDHVSIPGASATYRIQVEKNERQSSFSFYVAGNGFGTDSTLAVTQSLDDALEDAVAASVIHIMANALLVPYYRCSNLFRDDADLDNRVRDALNRLTEAQLEENIKGYMIVDGYPAMSAANLSNLTEQDHDIIQTEIRRHSITLIDHSSVVDFAFSLWKNLDWANGSLRIVNRLSDTIWKNGEQQEAAAQRASAEAIAKQQREATQTAAPPPVPKAEQVPTPKAPVAEATTRQSISKPQGKEMVPRLIALHVESGGVRSERKVRSAHTGRSILQTTAPVKAHTLPVSRSSVRGARSSKNVATVRRQHANCGDPYSNLRRPCRAT